MRLGKSCVLLLNYSRSREASLRVTGARDRTQNAHRICNRSAVCDLCGLWNQQLLFTSSNQNADRAGSVTSAFLWNRSVNLQDPRPRQRDSLADAKST